MIATISQGSGAGTVPANVSARTVGKLGWGAATALGVLAAGAGTLVSNGVALAAAIPVANYNFSSGSGKPVGYNPAQYPGSDSFVTDWGVSKGVQANGSATYSPIGLAGNDSVYSESGYYNPIYQDVGALLPNTTYTLSVDVSNASYGAGGTAVISLYNTSPDSNTLTQVASGTLLAATTISNIGLGSNAVYTAVYNSPAVVSGDLTIELVLSAINPSNLPSNTEVIFSNVGLTGSPVPEPATLGLLALGGAGLLLLGRRRTLA